MTDHLYNHDAEQLLLGAILLEPDSLLHVTDIIEPQDLYEKKHQNILNACMDLYQLGEEAISLISVSERLRLKGQFEQSGGSSYLSELACCTPTAANIKDHARLIRKKSLKRKINKLAMEMQGEVSGIENIADYIAKIENRLIEISERIKGKRCPKIASILSEIKRGWQQEREGVKSYIPTDDKLYQLIPGYYPGHLIVVGGYTSVGKSTVLVQIITDVCYEGAKCLIFSTEDSRKDKTIKLLSNLSDISQQRLVTADFNGHEADLNKAEDILRKWDIKIYDDVYSVNEMRLKIKKHKFQGGLDIVCVDYIQNIQGQGTIYERMADAIIKLQAMAKEFQVALIVLSQVNNAAMKDESGIIGLKGAGELAAAADIVLWLRKVKDHERHLDCEIRKNRPFGKTGIVPLQFSENWTRIERRMQ